MQPFRDLLKPGNKFYWDEALQNIFEDSKKKIISDVQHGVRIFDPKRKTCLTTDWSKHETGFFLSQKHYPCKLDSPTCCKDGWKVIFAGRKFNTPTETNYSPIEGECLAVVKALQKARYFVLGCGDLLLATDQKPLTKVLGDRRLEDISNHRLLNLKEKTLRYSFKIIHIPGRKNSGADAASRYPTDIITRVSSPEDESHDKLGYSEQADQYSLGIAVASLSIIDGLKSVTWSKIQNATLSDPDMLDSST